MATAPLAEDRHEEMDDDSELSLNFQLGELKMGLSEVKEKIEEVRSGSRGSRGGSCEFQMLRRCTDAQVFPQGLNRLCHLFSVSSNDMMAAESMLSLRASTTSLRASTTSLRRTHGSMKGERSKVSWSDTHGAGYQLPDLVQGKPQTG